MQLKPQSVVMPLSFDFRSYTTHQTSTAFDASIANLLAAKRNKKLILFRLRLVGLGSMLVSAQQCAAALTDVGLRRDADAAPDFLTSASTRVNKLSRAAVLSTCGRMLCYRACDAREQQMSSFNLGFILAFLHPQPGHRCKLHLNLLPLSVPARPAPEHRKDQPGLTILFKLIGAMGPLQAVQPPVATYNLPQVQHRDWSNLVHVFHPSCPPTKLSHKSPLFRMTTRGGSSFGSARPACKSCRSHRVYEARMGNSYSTVTGRYTCPPLACTVASAVDASSVQAVPLLLLWTRENLYHCQLCNLTRA